MARLSFILDAVNLAKFDVVVVEKNEFSFYMCLDRNPELKLPLKIFHSLCSVGTL